MTIANQVLEMCNLNFSEIENISEMFRISHQYIYIYVTPVGAPCKQNLKFLSKIALAPRRLRMAAAVAGDLFYF